MNKVVIIAEAGVNHNGSLEIAKKLVRTAKDCGVDYVKFQTFKSEKLVSKNTEKASYQKENTHSNESQLSMLKSLELTDKEFYKLKEYCDSLEIKFLSTPFDMDSIDFLDELGMEVFKIPSGEINNLPYLEKIASKKKTIILSTGMSTLDEVSTAINILNKKGCSKISLLHCTTEYPAPLEDVNLNAMLTMKHEFNLPVGYSDHTQGIEVSLAAVALGACIIEKHFTLDKTMPGPDHKASLEPNELKELVQSIRKVEKTLGDGIKSPSPSELKNIPIARRSIVALCNIKAGEEFTEQNIICKRPGTGISPMNWYNVLGHKAKKDFFEDELIEL